MANPVDVVQLWVKATNDHDVKALAETYSPGCEVSYPDPGGQALRGKEQVIAFVRRAWESFPVERYDIKLVVSEGSVVVAEYTWTATNTGPLHLPGGRTIPATGREVVLPCVDVFEVRDGLIAEERGYWDVMALTRQLGLLPTRAT